MNALAEQLPTNQESGAFAEVNGPHVEQTTSLEAAVELDGTGASVAMRIKPVVSVLREDGRAIAERQYRGLFVESQDGASSTFVQSVAGPLHFRAYGAREQQLVRERRALETIDARAASVGDAALRVAGLVTTALGTKPSKAGLHETTVPGVYLFDAVRHVQNARAAGRLSDDETATILGSLYGSALDSLTTFHSLGLLHGHAHPRNFIVDPATGVVHLIDYTLAARTHQGPIWGRQARREMIIRATTEEKEYFGHRWHEHLQGAGLPTEYPEANEDERQAAVAKLGRAVALSTLSHITGSDPTEDDIDRFLKVQRDLLRRAA